MNLGVAFSAGNRCWPGRCGPILPAHQNNSCPLGERRLTIAKPILVAYERSGLSWAAGDAGRPPPLRSGVARTRPATPNHICWHHCAHWSRRHRASGAPPARAGRWQDMPPLRPRTRCCHPRRRDDAQVRASASAAPSATPAPPDKRSSPPTPRQTLDRQPGRLHTPSAVSRRPCALRRQGHRLQRSYHRGGRRAAAWQLGGCTCCAAAHRQVRMRAV